LSKRCSTRGPDSCGDPSAKSQVYVKGGSPFSGLASNMIVAGAYAK